MHGPEFQRTLTFKRDEEYFYKTIRKKKSQECNIENHTQAYKYVFRKSLRKIVEQNITEVFQTEKEMQLGVR